jgi:signal transduction histidine kinase
MLECIDNLKSQAIMKNITLQAPDFTDEIYVICDVNMVYTIFRNLVSNAIKFSHKESTIEINVSDFADDDNYVQVSIKDSGIGIPDNVIKKLFRIDEKVTTKGTNKETGTGLGLILCKEFIDKHNCKI